MNSVSVVEVSQRERERELTRSFSKRQSNGLADTSRSSGDNNNRRFHIPFDTYTRFLYRRNLSSNTCEFYQNLISNWGIHTIIIIEQLSLRQGNSKQCKTRGSCCEWESMENMRRSERGGEWRPEATEVRESADGGGREFRRGVEGHRKSGRHWESEKAKYSRHRERERERDAHSAGKFFFFFWIQVMLELIPISLLVDQLLFLINLFFFTE